MASGFSEFLRSDVAELELSDVLQQPTTKLLGVPAAAGEALQQIGIKSIFDLAASLLFSNARDAASAGKPSALAARYGMVPRDWLQQDAVYDSPDELGGLPLEALRGLTAPQAAVLKQALDVSTISDFAKWPPYNVAHSMLGDSLGGGLSVDDIQTEALRPRFGEYPTERVYYTTLIMLDMGGDANDLVDLHSPIPFSQSMTEASGARKPAIGALVTLSQSWYAQGITLGQMIHSLALAPGEATRIAVVDWARRTLAQASESIDESEALAQQTLHQRALSEVQNAVAAEMQSGGSTSHVESSSSSGGIGGGISAIIPIYGALLGSAFGGSYQGASTTTDANSTSWSLGSRSVTATLTQNVNDRTEQHSTLVRNRRATAVREVSQSEHEQVSTRIVANYNHMHALTVQYYEVVQVYRTVAEIQSAERVLFIPIELIDFNSGEIVDSFRGILARAALTARARDLLLDPTEKVEIRPVKTYRSALLDDGLRSLLVGDVALSTAPATASVGPAAASDTTSTSASTTRPTATARSATSTNPNMSITSFLSNDDAVIRGSTIVMCPVVRPQSSSLFYPREVELLAAQIEGASVASVTIATITGGNSNVMLTNETPILELPNPLYLSDISEISVRKDASGPTRGLIRLHLNFSGRPFTTPALPLALPGASAASNFSVLRFLTDTADRRAELQAHLNANRAYYSAEIYRSLGSAAVVGILSKYKWKGKPLVDQVEPKILSVAGNFIVLRAPIEEEMPSGITNDQGQLQTWGETLKARALKPRTVKDSRIVPIPTDGVFAEAVLGRSNSAEKLDITRFWNWHDSPAPLTPPELAPVSTGSRATQETLTPGTLGPATLNIVNPTNLPDPTGLGAALGALTNLNFRDMGGLSGTQQLAGTATSGTLTATTEAGRNATAMAQVAADVVKTAITAGYGRKKEGGVSGEGARINHGRDLDERKGGTRQNGAADGTVGTQSFASGSAAGVDGGGRSAHARSSPGYEETAYDDSVGMPLGPQTAGLVTDALLTDESGGGTGLLTGAGGSGSTQSKSSRKRPVSRKLRIQLSIGYGGGYPHREPGWYKLQILDHTGKDIIVKDWHRIPFTTDWIRKREIFFRTEQILFDSQDSTLVVAASVFPFYDPGVTINQEVGLPDFFEITLPKIKGRVANDIILFLDLTDTHDQIQVPNDKTIMDMEIQADINPFMVTGFRRGNPIINPANNQTTGYEYDVSYYYKMHIHDPLFYNR